MTIFPHPQPFSLREQGSSPLARWERGRGRCPERRTELAEVLVEG